MNGNADRGEIWIEAHAIDVFRKSCKLCTHSDVEYKSMELEKHFALCHTNMPIEYDVVKSRKWVQCSTCGKILTADKFLVHKLKVHVEPQAIDVQMKVCKVCRAEYVTEWNLQKHFSTKHQDVPGEFVEAKSDKIVRCSSCRFTIKKKNFATHKPRCNSGRKAMKINSYETAQLGSAKSQVAETVVSDHPLVMVTDVFEGDICETKLITKKVCEANINTAHVTAPKLFGCKLCCATNIFEENLAKHYQKNHRSDSDGRLLLGSMIDDFYLLDLEKQQLRLKCPFCNVLVNENRFDGHLRRVHSKSFAKNENAPPAH